MTAEEIKKFCYENAKQLAVSSNDIGLMEWEKRVKTFLPTVNAYALERVGEITAAYYEWFVSLNSLETCKDIVDRKVGELLSHMKK